MSQRLSRSQRESIIIDYLNGKETPGYKVIENVNGKFTVKHIKEAKNEAKIEAKPKFEIEEEDINEREARAIDCEESESKATLINQDKDDSDDDFQSLKQAPKQRTKQDARELLRQLSQLLNEDGAEDEIQNQNSQGQFIEKRYKPGPQNWQRRKLVF